MAMLRGLILAAGFLAGCDEAADPTDGGTVDSFCAEGDFLYDDLLCGRPLSDGGSTCTQRGDLTYYRRCATDGDCCEPSRPHCSVLGLFHNGDYSCNWYVRVCRARATNDCGP